MHIVLLSLYYYYPLAKTLCRNTYQYVLRIDDVLMCMQKANKAKKKGLKPFKKLHPTRDEIINTTTKYKKSLRKTLQHRLEEEQMKEKIAYERLLQNLIDRENTVDTV